MKMLTIACRESLLDDVWAVLMRSGIKGFTLIGKVVGRGEMDMSPPPLNWEGHTNVFIVVLSEEQMPHVIDALKALHDKLAKQKHGLEVPLKIFSQPCEVIL